MHVLPSALYGSGALKSMGTTSRNLNSGYATSYCSITLRMSSSLSQVDIFSFHSWGILGLKANSSISFLSLFERPDFLRRHNSSSFLQPRRSSSSFRPPLTGELTEFAIVLMCFCVRHERTDRDLYRGWHTDDPGRRTVLG